MSRRGPASSMSPLSSMPSPGGSSAGGSLAQRGRASFSTPWSRRSTIGGPSTGGLVHHSDRGVQYVSIKYTERLAGRHRAFGRQRRRQLRQCSRRNDQRPVQDRGHPPPRPMAHSRLSSSPPSNGSTGSTTVVSSSRSATSRLPRRERTTLSLRQPHGRVELKQMPPGNPARFSWPIRGAAA